MLYFEKTATVFPNKTAYLLRDGARIVAKLHFQPVKEGEALISEWNAFEEGSGYGKMLLRRVFAENSSFRRVRSNGFTQSGKYNFARVADEFGFTQISPTLFYRNVFAANENKRGGKMRSKHQVRHVRKRGNKLFVAGKKKMPLWCETHNQPANKCAKRGQENVFDRKWYGGKMKAFGCEVVGIGGGRQPFLVPWKQKQERVVVLKDGRKIRMAKIVYYPRGLLETQKRG